MEALLLNSAQRILKENYRPPCVPGNMQMTWPVLPVLRAKAGSPAAYPPGCLGTGTAPAVKRAPFLRIQGLQAEAQGWGNASTQPGQLLPESLCPACISPEFGVCSMWFSLRTSTTVHTPKEARGFLSCRTRFR